MQKLKISFILKWILLLLFNTSIASAQEIKWQNTIGGSGDDELSSIQQTTDGGYILGGWSLSNISGDKSENSLGFEDYWIVKLDSLGNIQWQNTIGGNGHDILKSIQQTSDGGYILGGHSDSNISGDKSENRIGFLHKDYWIVKVDSVGVVQWQNTIGGSGDEEIASVLQTSDNGYILGGSSMSDISGDKTENCFIGDDYWIIKVDSIGSIQWQNTIGGNSLDNLRDIQITTDGGYILGGISASNISGNKTENTNGEWDYWIVKVDSLGAIQWQNNIGGNHWDNLYTLQETADGGYIMGGSSSSNISGDKTEYINGSLDYWIVKVDSLGNIQWQNTIGGRFNEALFSIKQTTEGGYFLGGYSESLFSVDKTENNNSYAKWDYWVINIDSLGNIKWQNTIGGVEEDYLISIQKCNNGGYILGGFSDSNISADKTENSNGLMDYWIIKLTDNYNLVSGMLFADMNNNSLQDSGEPSLSGKKITEQNSSRFSFSQVNGRYSVSVPDTGSYTVTTPSLLWYNTNPGTHTASFTGIQQIDSLNDFAFQPQGIHQDVFVTITPLGPISYFSKLSYLIDYGNYGTTTVTPTVSFYPYSNVTYQSATLTPSNVTPDSVMWNLPALAPFQTGSIIVTVFVIGLPFGTFINSSAHIEPYLTDDNPSNNNSSWMVYRTQSFNPNDILVNEDTLTTSQLNSTPWLDYIIRFQNTGNDTVFTVKILNPVDTNKLNISTIEFVSSSHPVNLNWINYQRNMEFKFENILLVDSNTNEPLSHGFVRYRIQPKTNLSAGDIILNFAAIYFDFNEPVITNNALTFIILPTGLTSASPTRGKLHVFPNPTENTLNISGIPLENGKAQLRLMDIYGKLIMEKTITSITTTLETNNLSSGIYLIQSGEMRATFVKQ